MDQITIAAQRRTALGKKVRALRRSGVTPIHVYGRDTASASLQVDTVELIHTIGQVGFTTPLTISVDGDDQFVMIRDIQRHPVTEHLLHVDLMAISRTERRLASVPLHFEGESPAIREEGAQLFEDLHALDVEALPLDIPSGLTVDLSVLVAGDSVIHAGDIPLPANVTLVTEPGAPIVRVVHRRGSEEGETLDEGPVAVEGEAAAAAAPAAEEPSEKA
jgi:large subunit ribosomal protein L25